jgi:polysaccharide export outer membrane protein
LLALLLLGLFASVGCGSTTPFVWVQNLPDNEIAAPRGAVERGDRILVVIQGHEPLSGEFVVRDDGTFAHPLLGPQAVVGLTPQQIAERTAKNLKGMVIDPRVSVSLVALHPSKVSVLGEVHTPGIYDLDPDDNVLTLLARAGGLSEFADKQSIYVVRKAPKLERIRFTFKGLTTPESKSTLFRLNDRDVIVVE